MNQADKPASDEGRVIVLFDGVCALCNGIVRFTRKRMKPDRLLFAPLQSPAGQALLEQHGLDPEATESVVVIDRRGAHLHSDAALRLMRELRFPWPVFAVFRIIPRPIRDAVYNWIARKRFDWFGRTEACPLPDAPSELDGGEPPAEGAGSEPSMDEKSRRPERPPA